ncbi:hypothetical protein CDV31_008726 [Fusarium ambrosium]|uniref:DUF6546 domain-containing protein n=1 Tax=Fusarium ambrosium TaxID=131363 RepID=A0A428TYS3_9HYPO|nr:hypothetical protein CDV31_008726 [Fusarium ambrosium]
MADEAPEIPRIPPTFGSLPAEIRLNIIATASEDPPRDYLALVCKEWQHEVEKKTFESLVIGRRQLLPFLDYIKLPEYGCRFCPGPQDYHSNSSAEFRQCLKNLLRILNRWTRGNLTLEIDAYSPSDSEHFFKGYYVGDPDEDEAFGDPRTFNDGKHEFSHNGRSRPQDRDAREVYHMFGGFFLPAFNRATVVKRLIIRRQCRRQYHPRFLSHLLPALPALEHIHYEPWRMHDEVYQDREWYPGKTARSYLIASPGADLHATDVSEIISRHLPRNLKTLTLFEDFNEDFWPGSDAPERIPNAQTAEALLDASLELKRVSASFMVDAQDFFSAYERCYSEHKWEKLEFLALTSRFVGPGNDTRLTELLEAAGTFAPGAPRLRTMILWYGRRNRACAFLYNRDDTSITWQGIWPFDLNQQFITRIWERVADSHNARVPLSVRTRLVTDEIKSHGDAIHYLGLPAGSVVDALSLRQIRLEGRIVYKD